ncbi:hypothetical protein LPJ66_005427 [Kickxella alabastrina]|uniref:Uncharacterized protein n=1 Tax=Kickxella alabastrina TaxID=61397 RepID=A0ACC1IF65_9FUNG|nr:hypothetical protein LPJ66_005427 [Kickxella alabastrina]
MDVTRDNFAKALEEFRQAIGGCDFVAIDMEMTGLYETKQLQPSRLDTTNERYSKLKRSVESYGVIQVGICLFTWVDTQDESSGGFYEARPFNFNVFPCTSVSGIPVEAHFGCKNTAFEFLARNSFDFNKWVYSGIPYMRSEEARQLKAERTSMLTNRQPRAEVDERHRVFVRDLDRVLKTFVASREKTMRHETANSYQRKLVYELVASHDTLGARSRPGFIEVFKGTKKTMAQHTAHKLRQLAASIEEARGFCAIIDLLSAARKPVVGHNMPLDILHAYSKFYRQLPESRVEFESAVLRFLPVLIDTKYIIESTPGIKAKYGTSNLDEIAPVLEKEALALASALGSASSGDGAGPGAGVGDGDGGSGSGSGKRALIRNHANFTRDVSCNMHEAGYDAYMTGATFIRLLHLEGGLNLSAGADCEDGRELVLYRYINKMYLAISDAMFWQLATPEEEQSGESGLDVNMESASASASGSGSVSAASEEQMPLLSGDTLFESEQQAQIKAPAPSPSVWALPLRRN